MSGFITNGSEFKGKELTDIILRPILQKEMAQELGVRVFLAIKSSVKLTFFGPTTKILKAYADGWQGGSAAAKNQKKLTLSEFKAEQQLSKQAYKETILEEITNRGGISQNDISGTNVMDAELSVFMAAVKEDVRRYFWLGDSDKQFVQSGVRYDSSSNVVVDANGTYVSGGKDIFYNVRNGVWKSVMGQSATSPTANQIKRVAVSNGTTAQEEVQTLSGITAGTVTLTINGVAYSQAYSSSAAGTATAFFTTHAAALALLDITLTNPSSGALKFVSAIAGQPFVLVATSAGTGGTWTQSAVVANVAAQALGTDEAVSIMKSCFEGGSDVMKNFLSKLANAKQARYFVTDTIFNNYRATLEALGTEKSNTLIVDGVEFLSYRGIPLISMGIDNYLANDFISPYPHRVLLTVPNNLGLVLNGNNDDSEVRMWFNPDENVNRQRAQFEFGMDFILPEWCVAAY